MRSSQSKRDTSNLRKGRNQLGSFIGKPGYEILLPAHPLDLIGDGIWNPDIAPGDLVHIVDLPENRDTVFRTGMLVMWLSDRFSKRINAQVLNNKGKLEWWDHYWRLQQA